MEHYLEAAMGITPFDLLFIHARVVDVYLERIIEDASIGVCDGIICAINPSYIKAIKVIDCEYKFLIPGFMDPHVHIETSHLNPIEWSRLSLENGTTTIFCDLMLMGNVFGENTISMMQSLTKNLATRIFYNIPSKVPAYPGRETCGGELDSFAVGRLLENDDVTGLGEVNALSVLLIQENILEKINKTRKRGKRVSGHCPDIATSNLNILAAAGLTDDHESITYEEVKEKLSRGIAVMIRDGSVETSVKAVIPQLVKENLPTDSIMFCTDDKNPVDIKENGHLNATLRKAVQYGLDPIKAIRMVTLNVAKYFRMDEKLGSITPGRYADLVIVDDLHQFNIKDVFVNGKCISEMNRKNVVYNNEKIKQTFIPFYHSLKLFKSIKNTDFEVYTDSDDVVVRVIDIDPETLLTKELPYPLQVCNHIVIPDPVEDILKLAVIERYGKNGNIGHGFIRGIGIKEGAIACSLAQESNNIIVCGIQTEDMAVAVNKIVEIGGGYVLVKNGSVIYENSMPLGGIMYDVSYEESIKKITKMQEALEQLGCMNPNVFTYLAVGSAASIPEIGITDYGLLNSRTEQIVPLFIK